MNITIPSAEFYVRYLKNLAGSPMEDIISYQEYKEANFQLFSKANDLIENDQKFNKLKNMGYDFERLTFWGYTEQMWNYWN